MQFPHATAQPLHPFTHSLTVHTYPQIYIRTRCCLAHPTQQLCQSSHKHNHHTSNNETPFVNGTFFSSLLSPTGSLEAGLLLARSAPHTTSVLLRLVPVFCGSSSRGSQHTLRCCMARHSVGAYSHCVGLAAHQLIHDRQDPFFDVSPDTRPHQRHADKQLDASRGT